MPRAKRQDASGWTYATGSGRTRVVAYSDAFRGGALMLRWRDHTQTPPNWAKLSLRRKVETDSKGKITAECESFAIAAAQQKSLELAGKAPAQVATERERLTVGGAEALITAPDGLYPLDNAFRRELVRALRYAVAVWGADTSWSDIEERHWVLLLRRRLEELLANGCRGARSTEITVSRVITTVRWLRQNKLIPRDAAPWPDKWKDEIEKHWRGVTKIDRPPQPHRPRYTVEEFQKILAAADFDPRLRLLMRLAVGLRPGQVLRTKRSDFIDARGRDLPPIDWAAEPLRHPKTREDITDYGSLMVHGAGKKGGAFVALTRGQRWAVEGAMAGDGYLAGVEAEWQRKAIADYQLFPTGWFTGRVGFLRGKERTIRAGSYMNFGQHCTGSWLRKNWRTAEARAGIEHQPGRGSYGQRRITLDQAVIEKLSPSGIQALGGWTNSKIALDVYQEGENRAGQLEARPLRAKVLGEDGD